MSEGPDIHRIDEYRWELPRQGGMRVPGVIYADETLMKSIMQDKSLQQVMNVAHLPGILRASLAMPDIHWGYGFPIGGVAAFDLEEGIISPGGVGYDISCGVRLMRSHLTEEEVRPRLKELVRELFQQIPTGVGSGGAIPRLSRGELTAVCREGSRWAIGKGFGWPEDGERIEDEGAVPEADPHQVSDRAFERGKDQIGTLGSGNHFLEMDVVETVFEKATAEAFGLFEGQVVVLVHCGSRGFGYQVCDDYLRRLGSEMTRLGIQVPDRQLACVPFRSQPGQDYYHGMSAAVNYARANRQVITHLARRAWMKVFQRSAKDLGLALVYDVSHNVAKIEEYEVKGKRRKVCVHRKGATRAFPAGHPDIPECYRAVGQPVFIPGDMGRASYVLVGTQRAMEETWGSTCHGAGRIMSRTKAVRESRGRSIERELEAQGVIVMAKGRGTLAEEMPQAYKNVQDVVDVVEASGISKKVAKLRPIGVIKG